MEGLIPMFYKAIKKNRIRSRYSTLSNSPDSDPSNSHSNSYYDIAEFYVNPPSSHINPNSDSNFNSLGGGGGSHRRHSSVGDYELKLSSVHEIKTSGTQGHRQRQQQQQLVRFRSQKIMSCLTGH